MFSDLRSVRSVPTKGKRRGVPRSMMESPDFFSPSEYTPAKSSKGQHWRSSLHPEVDEHYKRIMRGEEVSWAGRGQKWQKKVPTGEGYSSGHSAEGEEQKLKSLQQQNRDLRDELYYLRQALLANFTQREQHISQQHISDPEE